LDVVLGVAGLVLLSVVAVLVVVELRWRATTARLVTRLRTRDDMAGSARPFTDQLEDLPAPVQRYFRAVLDETLPAVRIAHLRQIGQFLVRPGTSRWGAFTATQVIAVQPLGFVWDARIRMAPGVTVRVRDSFVDGSGSMVGAVLGLIPVVRVEHTPEFSAGALHRCLAEAVWCPTALLPAAGVVWTPIDDMAARASLRVGEICVSLDFHFDGDGLVRRVFTPERARDVGGHPVPTPWQGHFTEYAVRHGVRIPMAGEVEWLLPEGPQPYWRGRIIEVAYEHAQPTVPVPECVAQDQPERFELHVTVAPADIDRLGHVNNVVYLRWVQDAAVAHWNAAASAEARASLVWVVARHEIDYKRPALLEDAVIARTWVGKATGRAFERHTELVRAADGKLLARARTLWYPMDRHTGRPTDVSPEVRARFSVAAPHADGGR
jgi:acyl-CoA thioesterase FadM